MARLYLVRHAQASFGADDYDKLSELGLKQSTYIPGHFSDDPTAKRALYRGSMLRQKETADYSFPGLTPVINAGLNEFDHMNVLAVHQPVIHDKAKMTEIIMNQKDPRQFMEDEFRTAMGKWMNEEGTTSYNEAFRDFKSRVKDCISDIMSTARTEKQKEVIAVTSGGVISLYMTMLLDIPDIKMMDLNQHIANTSVTSVLFNDKKATLSYYNNFSHLPKDMVTFM
ncbi:MAG: histidine phosphatase family protein [Bacteroidetes bacterium]|nr:histidine phosphatase family protein [Bacteroidota bacterium]